ncbi:putative efflux pump antibiotic resistance protein [Aspergillus steynii IBT 23096]|uniref:Putative efflux pump antibiotic resistance protein n=1 Tax=Aspergillus steynii IBT 23096 TaxID=1392250 RepID=A0A2I2G7T0_9EURO|nr:putative efflux pump antibiotic resistance protein [Aspergillus steynii IBT 23096]PLB48934.1 putative efflux pump antibiotic resistance protein [Aspergillus steynii IBT 23096]
MDASKETTGSPAVEAQEQELEHTQALNALKDTYGATWDGPDDPQSPYNWTLTRKISIAMVVSCAQLAGLMSASMMAAALGQIAQDLGMSELATQIAFSIYMLGVGLGPFLVAALSEMYGRKPVWISCNVWYILWNSLCPVGNSPGLMMTGRFLAAIGGCVGVALTGPIMADMFHAKDRGKSLALATLIPFLGPALGPIIGGLASQHLHWHWLFWILSIFDAVVLAVGILVIKECYTPILLHRKARAHNPNHQPLHAVGGLLSQLRRNLYRPLHILIHRPIIQLLALIYALDFGIYILMLSTYASLWIDHYGQSQTISSLNYIAIAVGTTLAAQIGGHLMDFIYRRMRDRATHGAPSTPTPEFRVPYLIPSVALIPVGLFWYGWAAESHAPWIVVDLGAAIFTWGSFMIGQGLMAYLLDEFTHTASANAAMRLLSYILGFAFPIFAPQMYKRLGYGWGNSLLAFLFIGLAAPAPLVLWVWGPRLRAIGREKAP